MRKYFQIIRALGFKWVVFRIRYALRLKSGALQRRAPAIPWEKFVAPFDGEQAETRWLKQWKPFLTAEDRESEILSEARDIVSGKFKFYGFHDFELSQFPEWQKSPFDGAVTPQDQHWSLIPDFGFGDIKNIWELSRWRWAFILSEAWRISKEAVFAERFWELFENWIEKNPPNLGTNWKCGQEVSVRLFAAVFAGFSLANAPSTTPERLEKWRRLVRVSGLRIDANLDYALSQSNNHGVSECAGLMTAGALVQGNLGRRWFARGERELAKQVTALIYPDGGFSQHSTVYHRVLLHDLIWVAHVYKLENKTPPSWLLEKGKAVTLFLKNLTDPVTGAAHIYGASDGSNIFPFSEYLDFNPTISWAEKMFGGDATGVPEKKHFSDEGILIWRKKNISLFLRCPEKFIHRPSKADLLHLSILWKGEPVVIGAGSFSYNATGQFKDGFSNAFVHNTATANGCDQMEKASRFLYLPWPRGSAKWSGDGAFEASHDGYMKKFGARHTRRVTLLDSGDGVRVEDIFEAPSPCRWRLHWLLGDGDVQENATQNEITIGQKNFTYQMKWTTPTSTKVTVVSGDKKTTRGWTSPYYQHATPAQSVALELEPMMRGTVTTEFLFS